MSNENFMDAIEFLVGDLIEEGKIILTQVMECPDCSVRVNHIVDIFRDEEKNIKVHSYISCKHCEEEYNIELTLEIQRLVDGIVQLLKEE